MSAIGKGDWVQCVDAAPDAGAIWDHADEIVESRVYVVDDAFVDDEGFSVITLLGRYRDIAESIAGFRLGYSVDRFRPLGGNAKTLTAPPARVTEDA
jgi:hypothetical protein